MICNFYQFWRENSNTSYTWDISRIILNHFPDNGKIFKTVWKCQKYHIKSHVISKVKVLEVLFLTFNVWTLIFNWISIRWLLATSRACSQPILSALCTIRDEPHFWGSNSITLIQKINYLKYFFCCFYVFFVLFIKVFIQKEEVVKNWTK